MGKKPKKQTKQRVIIAIKQTSLKANNFITFETVNISIHDYPPTR